MLLLLQNVDVIGVLQEVQSLGEITIRKGPDAGKQKSKRNVSLVDKSGRLVSLTLYVPPAMSHVFYHLSLGKCLHIVFFMSQLYA